MHVPEALQDRVERWLRSRYVGDVGQVQAVGHGEWSQAFAFRPGGKAYVVRFSRLDEDFRKDRLASTYTSLNLPIPRVVDIGQAFDGFFAISERAFGEFLDRLDGPSLERTLPSLFAAMDAMREVDVSHTRGYGLWNADGTGPHATWREGLLDAATDHPGKRTFGWRAKLAASPTGIQRFDEILEQLRRLADAVPDERHLLHADLLNYNVLVRPDGRLSAILDWGSAMYGDFLFDLAWLTFWQPWYPAWRDVDFRQAALRHYAGIGLDVPRFAQRLRCCELCIGLDSIAYSTFRDRWSEVEARVRWTLNLAGS